MDGGIGECVLQVVICTTLGGFVGAVSAPSDAWVTEAQGSLQRTADPTSLSEAIRAEVAGLLAKEQPEYDLAFLPSPAGDPSSSVSDTLVVQGLECCLRIPLGLLVETGSVKDDLRESGEFTGGENVLRQFLLGDARVDLRHADRSGAGSDEERQDPESGPPYVRPYPVRRWPRPPTVVPERHHIFLPGHAPRASSDQNPLPLLNPWPIQVNTRENW